MPWTVIFLSSHWHTYLCTTSQIRVFSVDLTHSHPFYSLHSPTSSKSIFAPLIYVYWVDRETSSLSGTWAVVTPKPNPNKETQKNWKILFIPFISAWKIPNFCNVQVVLPLLINPSLQTHTCLKTILNFSVLVYRGGVSGRPGLFWSILGDTLLCIHTVTHHQQWFLMWYFQLALPC